MFIIMYFSWMNNVLMNERLAIVFNIFSDTFMSGIGVGGEALSILILSMPVLYLGLRQVVDFDCWVVLLFFGSFVWWRTIYVFSWFFWEVSKKILPGLDPKTRVRMRWLLFVLRAKQELNSLCTFLWIRLLPCFVRHKKRSHSEFLSSKYVSSHSWCSAYNHNRMLHDVMYVYASFWLFHYLDCIWNPRWCGLSHSSIAHVCSSTATTWWDSSLIHTTSLIHLFFC